MGIVVSTIYTVSLAPVLLFYFLGSGFSLLFPVPSRDPLSVASARGLVGPPCAGVLFLVVPLETPANVVDDRHRRRPQWSPC